MTKFSYRLSINLVIICAVLSGCSTSTIKNTQPTPITQSYAAIAEAELLNVGIQLFDPNVEVIKENDPLTFVEIRNAESRFIPMQLMQALQTSAAWGAVRVIPTTIDTTDVLVKGKILSSDGERLKIFVAVSDATGKQWFEKTYDQKASRYAYRNTRPGVKLPGPFKNIYNTIANDMLEYRRKQFSSAQLRRIRVLSEMRFAQNFAPHTYSSHLQQNRHGEYEILRLPASNDPMFNRIRSIRDRDNLYIDTMQSHYEQFTNNMQSPYQEWRSMSYKEAIALRKLKREAMANTILGVASIVAGIAGAASDNRVARASTGVAIIGGASLIKSGFSKRAEAEMHMQSLLELGASLEADIEPQVIELEDRTITLTGTAEDQYQQWRELLQKMHQLETGQY